MTHRRCYLFDDVFLHSYEKETAVLLQDGGR